ncbi:hypothetical protein B0J11DRAFT_185996 [Dendryphion nanum]|uniref:Zn(2)-C6 fungal-type domain-containing protein n=1 Tax=Dendryphion nanum TaxID=256645 RepID=A0A9P9D4Z5_9PLEO|nr:hypothetical protein B0J11DRAFT_185996 [Dendryphion nanum]
MLCVMKYRRAHSKSRLGCLPCKKRHIKCGQESPSCRNCARRGVNCCYALLRTPGTGPTSQVTSSEATRPLDFEQLDKTQPPPACGCRHDPMQQPLTSTTKRQELELMVHYITDTCETMAHGAEDIDIWRTVIPKEAVQHEFLMDGLLALSSLHLAAQNQSLQWTYTTIAIQYQNSGLRKFHNALGAITSDNSQALFAHSIMITIFALAFPEVCPGPSDSSHCTGVLSMFELLPGVGLIYQATGTSLRHGKLRGLFQPFPKGPEHPRPTEGVNGAFSRLQDQVNIIAGSADPERHQSYLSSIQSLHEVFRCMESSSHLGPVVAWPATVSKKLFDLFKRGDIMARLVFIYYGVLLLHARDRWWGRNVGVRLIDFLANSVCAAGSEWASMAEWARKTAALATQE